ncbi:Peptidase A1 domain-containing protein [Aphelenchoides fujianensis]|nr:Peptidase A1 domain-containing protein [Aphelenchoides fujianensis]
MMFKEQRWAVASLWRSRNSSGVTRISARREHDVRLQVAGHVVLVRNAELFDEALGERLVRRVSLDGILGLGWPSLAVDQVTPPIQQLIQLLDQPLFTIWLDRQPEMIGGTGALDSANCDEPLVYAPLTKEDFWQFDVDGFAVGTYSSTSKKAAILSTSTAFILAPADEFQQIIQPDGRGARGGLRKAASFPNLVFTVGGQQLRVPPSEYVGYRVPQQKLCGLAVDWNMDEGDYAWLLGEAFGRA